MTPPKNKADSRGHKEANNAIDKQRLATLDNPYNQKANYQIRKRDRLDFKAGCFYEELIELQIEFSGFEKTKSDLKPKHVEGMNEVVTLVRKFIKESRRLNRVDYSDQPYVESAQKRYLIDNKTKNMIMW